MKKGVTTKTRECTKHWHVIQRGWIPLIGDPMIGVLVITWVREEIWVEIGIDKFIDYSGQVGDSYYIFTNSIPGKIFLGGPKCSLEGKDIPYFVHWRKRSSMMSTIQYNSLSKLDNHDPPRALGQFIFPTVCSFWLSWKSNLTQIPDIHQQQSLLVVGVNQCDG